MSDPENGTLLVEVAYAERRRQRLVELRLPAGATAAEAVAAAGLEREFPEADFTSCDLGIWGRPVERSQRLRDGDRVEIYRPLQMDPREARRRLAAHGGAMGRTPGRQGS